MARLRLERRMASSSSSSSWSMIIDSPVRAGARVRVRVRACAIATHAFAGLCGGPCTIKTLLMRVRFRGFVRRVSGCASAHTTVWRSEMTGRTKQSLRWWRGCGVGSWRRSKSLSLEKVGRWKTTRRASSAARVHGCQGMGAHTHLCGRGLDVAGVVAAYPVLRYRGPPSPSLPRHAGPVATPERITYSQE